MAWLKALSPVPYRKDLSRLHSVGFVVARQAIEKASLDELPFIPDSLNPPVSNDQC